MSWRTWFLLLLIVSVIGPGRSLRPRRITRGAATRVRTSAPTSINDLKNPLPIEAALRDNLRPAKEGTVRVVCDGKSVGLGCVMDAGGLILTKASLLKDKPVCRTSDGTEFPARKRGWPATSNTI